MSTSASPGSDPRHGNGGADDADVTSGGPTSPGPGSTDAAAATAGSGLEAPDTGPGPAAADVDGPVRSDADGPDRV